MTAGQYEFDFDGPPPQSKEERREASKSILERIKKLLRLAADKRGNSHEAERAAALAFDLASRYHVDLAGLDLDDQSEAIVREYMHVGARLTALRQGVLAILQTFFHVTLCMAAPRLILVGRPTDIAIARYVHDFLLRAGADCLKSYSRREESARRRVTTAKRAGFIRGFIYGVIDNLRGAERGLQLTDSQRALVLADESARKAVMREDVPNTREQKFLTGKVNKNALEHGWDAGQATKITPPLGAADGRERLALPA